MIPRGLGRVTVTSSARKVVKNEGLDTCRWVQPMVEEELGAIFRIKKWLFRTKLSVKPMHTMAHAKKRMLWLEKKPCGRLCRDFAMSTECLDADTDGVKLMVDLCCLCLLLAVRNHGSTKRRIHRV
jgi:hypothetical protein